MGELDEDEARLREDVRIDGSFEKAKMSVFIRSKNHFFNYRILLG
jgi:hypothetical protein